MAPDATSGFDLPTNFAVLTTTYVIKDGLPILYVSHEQDDEGDPVWQFHCGNGDYSEARLMLVSISSILRIDPSVSQTADLPVGWVARRASSSDPWINTPQH
jgi:hypothetical protein